MKVRSLAEVPVVADPHECLYTYPVSFDRINLIVFLFPSIVFNKKKKV